MIKREGYTGLGIAFVAGIICGIIMLTMMPSITQASPNMLPTRPSQPTPSFPTRPATRLPATSTPIPETPTPTASSKAKETSNQFGSIELRLQFAQQEETNVNWIDLWTVVQQQDTEGNWRNVENWQGSLDTFNENKGVKKWWVSQANFGAGPFRWIVRQGQAGEVLANSSAFYLPTTTDEIVMVEVALAPPRRIVSASPSRPNNAYNVSEERANQTVVVRPIENKHKGLWSDNVYKTHSVGNWTVRATYQGQTVDIVLRVEAGKLDHIVVSPDIATITSGDSHIYKAEAFDAYGNSLGDVTANTNFRVVEDRHNGYWESNRYVGHTAGDWTIQASYNGKEALAELKVKAGPVDRILISPETVTQTAGVDQVYTAEAFDMYENSLGDITPETTFSIVEKGHNGQWIDNVYTPNTAGVWSVRGVYKGWSNEARLLVQGSEIDYLVISPAEAVVTAGDTQSYEVKAFDAYNNPLGPVTSDTTFSISEKGHRGQWRDHIYTAHTAGSWTVRGTCQGHTADVKLTVDPAELSYISISPSQMTMKAGTEQLFAAEGFDAYDNSLGNVSAGTTFSILQEGHNGRWSGRIYAAHTAGRWTVRGVYRGFEGDAELTVEPGELGYIVVTPDTTAVEAGSTQSFRAEAFDEYGNSLGDVTDETTFSVIDEE